MLKDLTDPKNTAAPFSTSYITHTSLGSITHSGTFEENKWLIRQTIM